MKLRHITMALLAAIPLFAACQEKAPVSGSEEEKDPGQEKEQPSEVAVPVFAKGADISWVSEMEKNGKAFKKQDGTKADIMDVLKEVGINSIRLRVWVNPEGGWSGKDDVVKLAGRAAKAGLAVMVDFHYSDFFADPSRQKIPAAWEADKNDLAKMERHVSEHTTEVLQALKDAGVAPAWVQVGNETRNGMLWPAGHVSEGGKEWTDRGWSNFITLYKAGYYAAKAIFPACKVMPHLNNAFDAEGNYWWFKRFKEGGAPMDMVALSHYPQYESNWKTTQTQALSYLKKVTSDTGVPVIISEVGVKTPANETLAAQVLSEFMAEVKKISQCTGVFYWEPEVFGNWKPAVYSNADAIYRFTGKRETWNAYDMGAFTSDGKASSVMNAFK